MPSTCRVCALVMGLTLAGAALADRQPTPMEQVKTFQKEAADAEAAYFYARAKMPDPLKSDDPVVEGLFQVWRKKQMAGLEAGLEIAKADPKSEAGFAALEWLLMTPEAYDHPAAIPGLKLLAEHHATNVKIGRGIAVLSYYQPYEDETLKQALALLNDVGEKNPDRTARGQAVHGLARVAFRDFRYSESKGDPNTDRMAAQAEKALETVVRDYGNCPNLRTMGASPALPLGDEAKTMLHEVRNLRIGKQAPDIVGEDLSGIKFKLSDYRGKVTLLVFWASWCGPCMAAVPHEKELVDHFKGRPFVLVGVNGDEKLENAKKAGEKHAIPWRSFWNGEKGAGGPISQAWNVQGWPTIYVIDAKGMIRQKYLHGKRLDDPLEKLVMEAEAAKGH
jgi:thiol-disulfide isomerase/thioredoxin